MGKRANYVLFFGLGSLLGPLIDISFRVYGYRQGVPQRMDETQRMKRSGGKPAVSP